VAEVASGAGVEAQEAVAARSAREDRLVRASTTAEPLGIDAGRLRRGHALRRIFVALLLGFVIAAAFGVFGVRTRTTGASAGALSARLEFASVNRRGVTSAFELGVRRAGGFGDGVKVRVPLAYLDTLAFRGMDPEPDSTTADAGTVEWTFTQPRGSSFALRIDAQIDSSTRPGPHRGSATVSVGDDPPVRLRFTTWVLP
jgi:hypothetical protein